MQLTIVSVDYAPEELHEQTPIIIDLVREIPGTDRPDYWLGELDKPIKWIDENREREISHVILAARWEGTRIESGAKDLSVGIAYVVDESLINDATLDFAKCRYVAIGISHETSDGSPIIESKNISSGTIGKFFGTGSQ